VVEALKAVAVRSTQPGTSSGRAFVSYISEDLATVQHLFDDLISYGANLWLDRNELAPGTRWKESIREAVQTGASFLACFSSSFVEKERTHMREELNLAIEEIRLRPADRSWFVPVKLDECDVPKLDVVPGLTLQDFQLVELSQDWNAGVRRIIDVIAPLPRQLRTLIDLLESPAVGDRIQAAKQLYRNPDRRAFKSLLRALDDHSDTMISYWAAQALAEINDPREVPALVRTAKTVGLHTYKLIEALKCFDTEAAQDTVKSHRKAKGDWLKEIAWFGLTGPDDTTT
jgi:TIR domain/HEAT repeats